MSLSSFFDLVELRTKLASVLPFIFGSLYTAYAFHTFNLHNALIMFCSMLLFDMTTTAINNYMDYKNAILQEGYGFEIHNSIKRHGLSLKQVKKIIWSMLAAASILGLYLAYRTDMVVLILGILCFIIGISYTYGPVPISRTPLGEFFSGITMGLLLTFISIYIHIFDHNILEFQLRGNTFLVWIDTHALIGMILVSMPFVFTIANIMLANNLCDIEEDLINKRYTLPTYLGASKALKLWEFNYYAAYVFIVIGALYHYLPWLCLTSIITIVPVKHHIDYFKLKQNKAETFVYAIQNFLFISLSLVLTLLVGVIVNDFLFK